jgi:hypothetical protein
VVGVENELARPPEIVRRGMRGRGPPARFAFLGRRSASTLVEATVGLCTVNVASIGVEMNVLEFSQPG